jgi:hypothetical protein
MLAAATTENSRLTARAAILPAALAALALLVSTIGDVQAETFQADAVEILDMPGNLVVEITQGTSIEIEINGPAIGTDRVDLQMIAGILRLDYNKPLIGKGPEIDVVLRIPEGMPLKIDDFSGTVIIGDLNGDLILRSAGKLIGRVGDTLSAEIGLNGVDSELELGDVAGALSIGINGDGEVSARSAGNTTIGINGAGAIDIARIEGSVHVAINGAGSVDVDEATGKVTVAINGSGTVNVGR